jgi:glycosyltransferase involved in cell wall biosynthesis
MLELVTPLILTYNEAPNIERTIAKLGWAKRIVVIDSGSSDGTLDLLRRMSNVEVVHREFNGFAGQCNFGLSQINTPWVLSMDADYELSNEFVEELRSLIPSREIGGYRARFVYRIWGHPLHGTLYPPRTVLYRKDEAQYENEGHGHRVAVHGDLAEMKSIIYHDDRKPLSRWLSSQARYAQQEVTYLLTSPRGVLSAADRLRLMGWPAPIVMFLYTLFAKRCILDGWPGWYYALQRLYFEVLTALEITDRRLTMDTKHYRN